jgi:hypothetical protein
MNLVAALVACLALAAAVWAVAELFENEPLISNDPKDIKAYCEDLAAERLPRDHEDYWDRVSDCIRTIETDGLLA